jgi:hypothetical protein
MIKTYINKSSVRKIVTKDRKKMWLAPGQKIELDDIDVRSLGANVAHIVPVSTMIDEQPVEKKEEAPAVPAPNPEPTTETKQDDAALRKELKGKLEDLTKANLTKLAKKLKVADFDKKAKKDDMIKEILKSAKETGYAQALTKV